MGKTWQRPLALGAVLVCIVVSCGGLGQSATTIPNDVKESIRARVDGGRNMGIVLGVVSESGVEFYSYGYLSESRTQSMDENTLFEIGSVGKTFTGVLLAEAALSGEVRLDDPIRQYLPDTVRVPSWLGKEITLLHLATHTSGLPALPENLAPADEMNPYADYTAAQLYEFLSGYSLADLGTRYRYSNFGFGLLGHILALRAGTTFERLLAARLTAPLGMTSTVMTPTEDMAGRLATGYRDGVVFPRWDNPTLAGAGGEVSTAKDLAAYVAANLDLVDTSLAESLAMSHQLRFAKGETRVAMGWQLLWLPAGTVVEHHGATGGTWSYVGFIKEKKLGVVVLTNTYENVDDLGRHILEPSYALIVKP